MRFEALAAAVFLTGCASTPTDDTAAADRACTFTDCFASRDVRDFQVVDRSTLIVFVGQQRCAFRVDLRGALCDMTFATNLLFTRAGALRSSPGNRGGVLDPFEIGSLDSDTTLLVCANDLQINVEGGAFGDLAGDTRRVDGFGNPRSECQVGGVASLTDDELIELYVVRGMTAPPPPTGSGEIEVVGTDPTGEEQGSAPASNADEAGAREGEGP